MYYLLVGIVLFIVGLILGFVWPEKSWRWGVWICVPIILLVGLSVLFAGNVDAFLKKDLPVMLVAFVASCVGGFLGARFKQRKLQK